MSTPKHDAAPAWAYVVATAGGLGRQRPAPGTWGSVGAAALAWLALSFAPTWWSWLLAAGILSAAVIGTWATMLAVRHLPAGSDPSWIVIDEVLGVWLALAVIPPASAVASPGITIIVGTMLFRVADILKPLPVSTLERLPGAWGIMADDAAAGLLAGLVAAALVS